MNPNLAMVHLNPGLVGGIVGAIIGVIGGLIGTYFSIKNTKGPRERTFVVKMSIVCWILVLAFVFAMCLVPGFYKFLSHPGLFRLSGSRHSVGK